MARLYSDTEIAALLARAAERQRAAPADGPVSGLTLDEIERLAAEAGLDPAHVRAAANELSVRAPAAASSPGVRVLERWIDVPFSDVAWEEAVTALRARHPGTNWAQYTAMGTLAPGGDLSRVGAAHEWRHVAWTGATTTLTASPRGARTRLRLTVGDSVAWSDRATAGLYGFTPAVVLGLVAAGVVAKSAVGSFGTAVLAFTVAFVAALALVAVLAAPAVGRSRRTRAERAAETLDVVAAAFEEAAPYATTAGGAVAPSGRVDFDAAVGDGDRDEVIGSDEVRPRRRESS